MKHNVIGIYTLGVIALIVWFALNAVGRCSHGGNASPVDTVRVERSVKRDTVIIVVHDSVPVVRRETVVRRVPVLELMSAIDTIGETMGDSLDIVQREYSDDSTYTAWVSGVRYAEYPRLDSIAVSQRTVTERVTETVTIQKRRSRWHVGLQAGYGYGLRHQGFEPYVGIGVTYSILPP